MKIRFLVILTFFITTSVYAQTGLIGWAIRNDLGQNGTTGGGDGAIVRVSSKAELQKYAGAEAPYTILVEGRLSASGMVEVTSNKSIIGTGSGAILDGFGIDIRNSKNIVIRNLTIRKAGPDAIAMRNTHHVWIDHCDLSASSDGLLDFTHGSDYLTVSWCIFHDHDKAALVNGGTQEFDDVGKSKATYHHNWFYNTVQRNPRMGYGLGHVFNNYYNEISSYCIGYHTGASILIENNYFQDSNTPLNQMYSSVPGTASHANAQAVGNIFDNVTGNTEGTGTSFDPGRYYNYKFALDNAKDIPSIVQKHGGPQPGIEHELLPAPANGSIEVYGDWQELRWSNLEGVTEWEVLFGTSPASLKKSSTTQRSFTPPDLRPGTTYFWKVNAVKQDEVIEGPLWRFRTVPAKASNPYPEDGELHAKMRQVQTRTACVPLRLTWTPGFNIKKYKVYLGKSRELSEADFKAEVNSPAFAPGLLAYGVTYYWRVDMIAEDGSVYKGDTWSFSSDITYSKEGKTEAEDMVLNGRAFHEIQDGSLLGYAASNRTVVSGEAGPGTMSSVWSGPDAICNISVSYFDENDGKGWYGFFVNDRKIDEWIASDTTNRVAEHVIRNVSLRKNDELRIEFYTNRGELNRTDYMTIEVLE